MSMKKFFIALSVLAALALSVVPSQALVGMPDNVPGGNLVQGFFIVEVDGGLDTAIVIQEVGNALVGGTIDPTTGAVSTASGSFRWHMWDNASNHVADNVVPYTRNDVVPLSVRNLITDNVTPAGLTALLDSTTFPTPVYIGYITFENTILNATATGLPLLYGDNLIGKTYLHNMTMGQASCMNIAVREYLPPVVPGTPIPLNWLPVQGMTSTTTGTDGGEVFAEYGVPTPLPPGQTQPRYEAFSPNSLAASIQRERGYGLVGTATMFQAVRRATGFSLYPRYYLHSAEGENFIFIWKSVNTGSGGTWRLDTNFFDTDENAISGFLTIAQEVNVINVRQSVPPTFLATYPAAGWINIAIPDIFTNIPVTVAQAATLTGGVPNPYWNDYLGVYLLPSAAEVAFSGVADVEFLAYNWQYANSTTGSLNWSGLFEVARDVNFLTR